MHRFLDTNHKPCICLSTFVEHGKDDRNMQQKCVSKAAGFHHTPIRFCTSTGSPFLHTPPSPAPASAAIDKWPQLFILRNSNTNQAPAHPLSHGNSSSDSKIREQPHPSPAGLVEPVLSITALLQSKAKNCASAGVVVGVGRRQSKKMWRETAARSALEAA
jgi:hypothetical protein